MELVPRLKRTSKKKPKEEAKFFRWAATMEKSNKTVTLTLRPDFGLLGIFWGRNQQNSNCRRIYGPAPLYYTVQNIPETNQEVSFHPHVRRIWRCHSHHFIHRFPFFVVFNFYFFSQSYSHCETNWANVSFVPVLVMRSTKSLWSVFVCGWGVATSRHGIK